MTHIHSSIRHAATSARSARALGCLLLTFAVLLSLVQAIGIWLFEPVAILALLQLGIAGVLTRFVLLEVRSEPAAAAAVNAATLADSAVASENSLTALETLALRGNANAANRLGLLFAQGGVVPRDFIQAASW